MNTARFIKRLDGTGEGRVYLLDPAMETYDGPPTEYVWVSATYATYTGAETYIFACDSAGNVTNWSELDGSFRGGIDHEGALENAGYTVVLSDI